MSSAVSAAAAHDQVAVEYRRRVAVAVERPGSVRVPAGRTADTPPPALGDVQSPAGGVADRFGTAAGDDQVSVPDRGRIEAALGREHLCVRRRRRELQVVPGLFCCIPRPDVSKAFPGRRASLTVVADDELALVVDEAGHQVARIEPPAPQDTLAADALPAAASEAPHLADPPHPAYRMAPDRGVQRTAEGAEVVHPHYGMVRLPASGDSVAGHPGPSLTGQPIDGAVTVDVRDRVEAFDRMP